MNDYLKKRQEHIFNSRPLKEKKTYQIPKVSEKMKKKLAEEKERLGGDDTELVKWYKNRMKYMSHCEATGIKVENKIYRYAIMSICHILPKSTCKSVATHPANYVILLPDLHTKFDAMSWEEREQMACWEIIRDRLVHVYNDLDPSEKRHFPESVEKYIQKNQPF